MLPLAKQKEFYVPEAVVSSKIRDRHIGLKQKKGGKMAIAQETSEDTISSEEFENSAATGQSCLPIIETEHCYATRQQSKIKSSRVQQEQPTNSAGEVITQLDGQIDPSHHTRARSVNVLVHSTKHAGRPNMRSCSVAVVDHHELRSGANAKLLFAGADRARVRTRSDGADTGNQSMDDGSDDATLTSSSSTDSSTYSDDTAISSEYSCDSSFSN